MAQYSTYTSRKRELLGERGITDQPLVVPTPPAVCVQPCVQLWHSEAMLAQADWPWLHSGWSCFFVTILYPTLARFWWMKMIITRVTILLQLSLSFSLLCCCFYYTTTITPTKSTTRPHQIMNKQLSMATFLPDLLSRC